MRIHVIDNIDAALSINLLAYALKYRSALASESRWHVKCLPFRWGHCKHLLSNRFKKLDALQISFNVKIIIMAFFFDTMETLFKLIFTMSNKSGILTSPSGMRSPLVV
jgi:hypothetical protein